MGNGRKRNQTGDPNVIAVLDRKRRVLETDGRPNSANYLYVENELFIRRADLPLADKLGIRLSGSSSENENEENANGEFVLVTTADMPGKGKHSFAEKIDELREKINVWPNHVMSVEHHVEFGPKDAPAPIDDTQYDLWMEREVLRQAIRQDDPAPEAPHVVVIDTGIVPPPWLPDILRNAHIETREMDDPSRGVSARRINCYFAHGTFVVGQLLGLSPECVVHMFRPDGLTDDVSRQRVLIDDDALARALRGAFRRTAKYSPSVLNLSLAGAVHVADANANEGGPLPATRQALQEWLDAGTKVVAAAGNAHRSDEYYPAAWKEVCAVGALDRNGQPTGWSNYGDWVNTWELGFDVVSTYVSTKSRSEYVRIPDDSFKPNDPENHRPMTNGPWDGYAAWSGTSFAAPRVSAKLVQGAECPPKPRDA